MERHLLIIHATKTNVKIWQYELLWPRDKLFSILQQQEINTFCPFKTYLYINSRENSISMTSSINLNTIRYIQWKRILMFRKGPSSYDWSPVWCICVHLYRVPCVAFSTSTKRGGRPGGGVSCRSWENGIYNDCFTNINTRVVQYRMKRCWKRLRLTPLPFSTPSV